MDCPAERKALEARQAALRRIQRAMVEGRAIIGNYVIDYGGQRLVLTADLTPGLHRRGTPYRLGICSDIANSVQRENARYAAGGALIFMDVPDMLKDPTGSDGWDLATTATSNILAMHSAYVDLGC